MGDQTLPYINKFLKTNQVTLGVGSFRGETDQIWDRKYKQTNKQTRTKQFQNFEE